MHFISYVRTFWESTRSKKSPISTGWWKEGKRVLSNLLTLFLFCTKSSSLWSIASCRSLKNYIMYFKIIFKIQTFYFYPSLFYLKALFGTFGISSRNNLTSTKSSPKQSANLTIFLCPGVPGGVLFVLRDELRSLLLLVSGSAIVVASSSWSTLKLLLWEFASSLLFPFWLRNSKLEGLFNWRDLLLWFCSEGWDLSSPFNLWRTSTSFLLLQLLSLSVVGVGGCSVGGGLTLVRGVMTTPLLLWWSCGLNHSIVCGSVVVGAWRESVFIPHPHSHKSPSPQGEWSPTSEEDVSTTFSPLVPLELWVVVGLILPSEGEVGAWE